MYEKSGHLRISGQQLISTGQRLSKRPPRPKENLTYWEMGRSSESVRQGVKSIAGRWSRSSQTLKKVDQKYGEKLVRLAIMHSCGSFIGWDDSLEAVIFSVLAEMIKQQENQGY